MNKQQSKQTALELWAKSRMSTLAVQKFEDKTMGEAKRRTFSKLSVFGHDASRLFFAYRRGDRLKTPKYQNTYRLEPFRPFRPETVDDILRTIMEGKLSALTSYQPDQMSKLSAEITADVLKAVRKQDYDRCKLVTQVSIIQRAHQGVHSAFECVWDPERDNYSYYVFENSFIHAWCCVFGLYYE